MLSIWLLNIFFERIFHLPDRQPSDVPSEEHQWLTRSSRKTN